MLGDDYFSQHVLQSYRDYLEQTSYKVYMSNLTKVVAQTLSGAEIATSWSDILNELDSSVAPDTQTETEEEIKTRIISKLNRKENT